jgi:hypothetical protein
MSPPAVSTGSWDRNGFFDASWRRRFAAQDLAQPDAQRGMPKRGAGRPRERMCGIALARGASVRVDQEKPSNRLAFSFRISGLTLSLKPASSKSFIQRSGVIKG